MRASFSSNARSSSACTSSNRRLAAAAALDALDLALAPLSGRPSETFAFPRRALTGRTAGSSSERTASDDAADSPRERQRELPPGEAKGDERDEGDEGDEGDEVVVVVVVVVIAANAAAYLEMASISPSARALRFEHELRAEADANSANSAE